ncbi:FG-GAP-like repeat-containing protein [Pirellulaceae bacterium SH449]
MIFSTLTVCLYLSYGNRRLPTQQEIRDAITRGDIARLQNYAERIVNHSESTDDQLMEIAEGLQRVGLLDEATEAYSKVSTSESKKRATSRWAMGEIYFYQGLLTESLAALNECLDLDVSNDKARERRIQILHVSGQRWKALSDVWSFTDRDNWDFDRMRFVGNHAKPIEDPEFIEKCLKRSPTDVLAKLGQARIAVREGRFQDAIRTLRNEIVPHAPDLVEAHVQLGFALLSSSTDELVPWNAGLPQKADQHPDIWWIRGKLSLEQQDVNGAVRCFSEAIRLDPDHHASMVSISQALALKGEQEASKKFHERAHLLEKLIAQLDQVNPQTSYFPPVEQMAILTAQIGRSSEAWAWTRMGLVLDPKSPTLRKLYNELKEPFVKNGNRLPRYSEASYLMTDTSYRDLPLPLFFESRGDLMTQQNLTPSSQPAIPNLADSLVLIDCGVDFSYFCSRPEPIVGRRMHESTGGGVGVLDYDLDGWPDIFLSQGCEWPTRKSDTKYSDALFRNSGRTNHEKIHFTEVTALAGIKESAFGQGVAVGDVNSDGFPDLYIANIGINQLWLNQGDGTFRDGNDLLPESTDQWTVSSVIIDIDNDGFAEIYDARYVAGEDVYTRLCNVEGQPRTCPPTIFQASAGRWLRHDGKAGFEEFSSKAYAQGVREGNALGVVAFRWDQSTFPSLFVANDQVANLLLVGKTSLSKGSGIMFDDESLMRGMAYDYQGRAQACMGVASGDINEDGRLDFVVTNFLGEHNAVYVQNDLGGFDDVAAKWGLVQPSLPVLGFGTQLLDIDNNTHLDLIVLNGHIDDMTHAKRPFRMPAQLFKNDGSGRFVELKPDKHPFFSQPALGRALATGDWNRDGKMDFIATDLEQKPRIVQNQISGGTAVVIELVGTQSHRNAIGTQIVGSVGEKRIYRQLVSGDGYMCSNQKMLHFGLNQSDLLSSVEVTWPSGLVENYGDLSPDSHWIAIEGIGVFRK